MLKPQLNLNVYGFGAHGFIGCVGCCTTNKNSLKISIKAINYQEIVNARKSHVLPVVPGWHLHIKPPKLSVTQTPLLRHLKFL